MQRLRRCRCPAISRSPTCREARCQPIGQPGRRRAAPTAAEVSRYTSNAASRADLWDAIRRHQINDALGKVGLQLPVPTPTSMAGCPSLNKALQHVLSEFVRRTRISLPHFVELMRGQTADDYRPNKRMLPGVLRSACSGYRHLEALLAIASFGVKAPLLHSPQPQPTYPANHKSAIDRYPVIIQNIPKEQDRWRCFVLDLDILNIWPEVRISPFGVLDKGDADPLVDGRAIHDLSFPTAPPSTPRPTRLVSAIPFSSRATPLLVKFCINKSSTRILTSSYKRATWCLPSAMCARTVGAPICLAGDWRLTMHSLSTRRRLSAGKVLRPAMALSAEQSHTSMDGPSLSCEPLGLLTTCG
jgi:hypothetical protein